MPQINRQMIVFSLNCFAAVMLALYIAFSIGLPRPFWAMLTVYITSQPLAGAVRSKAVYRLIGTLLGATATIVLVPNFVNAPYVLSFVLAVWVAGCLVVSLRDRSPRSYIMLLAGYTAAIIGFPTVYQPEAVFDVAVARVEEIGLGIVCAAAMHSLFFPRAVGEGIRERLIQWLDTGDHWLMDILRGDCTNTAPRKQLAIAASDIRLLATHLPFDTSRLRETGAAVQAIHERFLFLLPLLSGLSDRIRVLVSSGGIPETVQLRLDDVSAWLTSGARHEQGLEVVAAIREAAAAQAGPAWRQMISESLLTRLAQAVEALDECHALLRHIQNPHAPVSPRVDTALHAARARPLHRDPRLALRSGATTVITVMITCALWIETGWLEGAAAAALAAVFCALFAVLDDPVPAILGFGITTLLGVVVATGYEFAILPAIDGFPMLMTVLFPVLFLGGLYLAVPKTAPIALGLLIGISSALALQQTLTVDFPTFLNNNLAQYVALLIAIFVVRGMRSLTAEVAVQRVLRITWSAIAHLARRSTPEDPSEFGALMVDRLAIVTPKLSIDGSRGDNLVDNTLRDLRVAMNIMTVQQVVHELEAQDRAHVHELMHAIGSHYASQARNQSILKPDAILSPLQTALRSLSGKLYTTERSAVVGLVGLHRNLFPSISMQPVLEEQPS